VLPGFGGHGDVEALGDRRRECRGSLGFPVVDQHPHDLSPDMNEPAVAVTDRHGRGAGNVSGGFQSSGEIGDGVEVAIDLHRWQEGDSALGILELVQRLGLRLPRIALAARLGVVLDLKSRAVPQHDRGELCGGGSAIDRTGIAKVCECRQITTVTQMRICEDDAVVAIRLDRRPQWITPSRATG
jgi:hypothetical protein